MNSQNEQNLFRWLTPRRLVSVLAIFLVFYIIYSLRIILIPVFIALIFAYALNPVIDRFENWRLGRTGAVLVIMGVMTVVIGLFLLYLIPAVANEITNLRARLPEYFENLRIFLTLTLAPWLKAHLELEVPTNLLELETLLQNQIENILSQIGGTLNQGVRSAFIGTIGILRILINLLLIPFFFFFFLRDFPKIEEDAKELVPLRFYSAVSRFANKANRTLAQFFRGQLTVALMLAILYSAGLSIIGIDLAIFLGVLSGVLFLIPYIGLAVAVLLSILASLLNFSGFGQIFWILILYTALPLVEMFILTPRIVGSRLTLSPATVILALLCFGGLFGIVGVIIALPLTALLKVISEEFIVYYHSTDYYKTQGELAEAESNGSDEDNGIIENEESDEE